jgi:DNA-binding SARP family transcriptional activator
LNSPRIQTFLAYLAIHSTRPVTRQEIAFLFWPDSNENQARTSLRQLIFRLRQLWPEAPLYLDFQETSLQWKDIGLVKSDISAYLDAVTTAKQIISIPEKKMHLSAAVTMYQGDLFPESYDDWVIPYRQHFHQSILTVITELIAIYEAEKDYSTALAYADQLRKIDSLHEPAYQHLMRLYSLVGNRGKALQLYHELTTMLQDEFAADPSEETKSLYEGIQSSNLNWKTENRASYTFSTRRITTGIGLVRTRRSWRRGAVRIKCIEPQENGDNWLGALFAISGDGKCGLGISYGKLGSFAFDS